MAMNLHFQSIGNDEYVDTRTGEIMTKDQAKYRSKKHAPLSDKELMFTCISECHNEDALKAFAKLYGIPAKKGTYSHAHKEWLLPKSSLNILMKLFATNTYNGHGVFDKKGQKNFQLYFKPLVEHGYVKVLAENKQKVRFVLTQRTTDSEEDGKKGAVIASRLPKHTTN